MPSAKSTAPYSCRVDVETVKGNELPGVPVTTRHGRIRIAVDIVGRGPCRVPTRSMRSRCRVTLAMAEVSPASPRLRRDCSRAVTADSYTLAIFRQCILSVREQSSGSDVNDFPLA